MKCSSAFAAAFFSPSFYLSIEQQNKKKNKKTKTA